MTVKKAMDVLALEGLIFRKRGSGTYVKKTALKNGLNANAMEYEGLTKQLVGHEVKGEIISFSVEFPEEEIRETLMLDKHVPVYKIIRLRIVDGEPYIIEHTFMNANLIPGLSEEALNSSIYQYIHNELGLQFGGAYRKVEQVVHLEDGTPFEYSRSRNRYDKRSYTVVDLQNKNKG
ncbi:GntR family transcriptional regulator [Mycobacteroides abscessus subsp. abscessus]|nr:GntR family transcriptional regulator [Mycobacteroides abscessus subsp. abscessus]